MNELIRKAKSKEERSLRAPKERSNLTNRGLLRSFHDLAMTLLVGFTGLFISVSIAPYLPETHGISKTTWSILIASSLGLALSFSKLRKLERHGSSKIGYWFLYFVLASIGAKANLAALASAPVLILAGFVWVLIHLIVLLAAGRILRAPMCLLATASQANIGGPVSAPIVASVYDPALAPLGLLLGILGNIVGTYLGLLCSQLCYWAHLYR